MPPRQDSPPYPQRPNARDDYELDGRRPADPDGNAEHERSNEARSDDASARQTAVARVLEKTNAHEVPIEDAPEGAAGREPGLAGALTRAQERACAALAEASALADARLEIVMTPEGLILRGESPSARTKEFALELCRGAAGAIHVDDEVVVDEQQSGRGA